MVEAIERESGVDIKPWPVNGIEEKLAEVIIYPFIYREMISERSAAAILGIPRSAYLKTWKKKVDILRSLYRSWTTD